MSTESLLKCAGSLLWSSINGARRIGYRRGFLKARKLPCRVVSVGNIQVGGSGKTPIVGLLAQQALERGLKPLVLTRGYRSRWERELGVMAPFEEASSLECGDEAALLRMLVPGAAIAVGADRSRAFDLAVERLGVPDLVILEDGMQHLQIARDLELALVTRKSWSEVLHREFESSLERADLVLLTKGASKRPSLTVPQIEVKTQTQILLPTRSATLAGKKALLACGVGDPESVVSALSKSGMRVLETRFFPDHHAYRISELQDFARQAALMGATVVTTGKDWVKWRELNPKFEPVVIESHVEGFDPESLWKEVVWPNS